jgi:hypothetical protein
MVSYSAIGAGMFLMYTSLLKGRVHWTVGIFGATLAGVNLSHMGYNPSAIDKNFTKHVNDMQKRDGSEVMHSPHKRHEDNNHSIGHKRN